MLLSVFVKQVFVGFCGKTLGTDETVETIIIPIAVLPFDVVSHIVFVHCLVVTEVHSKNAIVFTICFFA